MDQPIPTSSDSPEARRYSRIGRWLEVADFSLGFAMLIVLLATGWTRVLRDWAYKGSHQHYTLALFFYVGMLLLIAKLLGIGLDYYGFRVEHRFHLSNQSLASWIADEAKGWLVGLLLSTILAELVYWAIRAYPEHWWLIAWAVFIVLTVFFAQIAPVVLFPLFYKFKPLENEDLKQRLVRLSERAGTRVRGVYEWKLSEKSKKANAALTGLGNTRRIILADTLLENYSPDEIEAVLAHELGHHVHRHVPKSIAVQIVITLIGFWAASEVLNYAVELRMFDSITDFANLPLLALVATALSLILMPVLNAYSRYNERQADRYCFNAIPSVDPFITAMDKLTTQNLSERAPSRLVEVFFHSHPAVSKRIAAAQVFAHNKPPSTT
jgi:STE24 endopeptidase